MAEDAAGFFDALPDQERSAPRPSRLPRLRQAERDQVELRPLSLEDLVASDHRVRLVWAFCETLGLGPLYRAIKAVEGRPGHPPAEPHRQRMRFRGRHPSSRTDSATVKAVRHLFDDVHHLGTVEATAAGFRAFMPRRLRDTMASRMLVLN